MPNNWHAERFPICFPTAQLAAANALAYLLDPDERGDLTFDIDRQKAGYVYAEIPLVKSPIDYKEIIEGRNSAAWRHVVTMLATERDRDDIDDETLELLRTSMLFGAECAFLFEEATE